MMRMQLTPLPRNMPLMPSSRQILSSAEPTPPYALELP